MIPEIDIESFLELSQTIPIVDVRSPGEYKKAHIPGAFNIPLFSDTERALIGTIYKQKSKDQAIILGLEIVGPKMKDLVLQAKKLANEKNILIHCWRGGMRSASVAWLFKTAGLNPLILKGGYKEYRRFSKQQLAQKIYFIVLSGSTGSGKTDILKEMHKLGEQIIDLENLAHHKGSAFGAIGQKEQLENEQFENNLFEEFRKLDPKKIIWIEDESKSIGKNFIPPEFFDSMRKAPIFKINIDKKIRIERLKREYTDVDKEVLISNINKIKKRLDGLSAKLAVEAVEIGDFGRAIDYTLEFYDKAYKFGLEKRENPNITEFEISEDNPKKTAKLLIENLNIAK